MRVAIAVMPAFLVFVVSGPRCQGLHSIRQVDSKSRLVLHSCERSG